MKHCVDLIVHSNERDITAYLTGYFASSERVPMVFAREAGFHLPQLLDLLKHHGEVQHVIVEEKDEQRVEAALKAGAPRYDFEIKNKKSVKSVRFEFSFDTPSKKVADHLKGFLSNLPKELELYDYNPEEEVIPEKPSVEIYAPDHNYRFQGKGVISGDVFAVVDIRTKLAEIDFVNCEDIHIDDE